LGADESAVADVTAPAEDKKANGPTGRRARNGSSKQKGSLASGGKTGAKGNTSGKTGAASNNNGPEEALAANTGKAKCGSMASSANNDEESMDDAEIKPAASMPNSAAAAS